MENLEKIARSNLKTHYYDNAIYFFAESEKEKYERIKEYLKEDYGFLDVILDFSDYKLLEPLISSVPTYLNLLSIKRQIIESYLNYIILREAKIKKVEYVGNIKDIESSLFDGDFERYKDIPLLL